MQQQEKASGFAIQLSSNLLSSKAASLCGRPVFPCLLCVPTTKATFRNRNAHSVYILAYVDDCVVTGGSSGAIEAVIDRIKTDYKVDDLGELHHFLGMEVIRDRPRRTLEININRYIQTATGLLRTTA